MFCQPGSFIIPAFCYPALQSALREGPKQQCNRLQLSPNHFQLPSNRFQLPSNRFQPPSNRFQLPSNRFQPPSNRFQPPSNRFQLPSNRRWIPPEYVYSHPFFFPFFLLQLGSPLSARSMGRCPFLTQSSDRTRTHTPSNMFVLLSCVRLGSRMPLCRAASAGPSTPKQVWSVARNGVGPGSLRSNGMDCAWAQICAAHVNDVACKSIPLPPLKRVTGVLRRQSTARHPPGEARGSVCRRTHLIWHPKPCAPRW